MNFLFIILLFNYTQGVHLFRPTFLSEDEINHERSERDAGNSVPCDEDMLMNFLAEIQIINPESIVKFATLNEIQPSCKKVAENLEKIKNYLKGCTPPNQPDLYYQLIKGVESLHTKLCTESSFKKKFQSVHKCLYELRNDFENCEGPADWNENSDEKEVCKAYKAIADCYYIKTAKVCGTEAASIAKELLQSILDSVVTINCQGVRSNPKVSDPMPSAYIAQTSKSNVLHLDPYILLTCIFFLIYLYKIAY